MKIDQTQLREEPVQETAAEAANGREYIQQRMPLEEIAEGELQKLFLARLDVHSRIQEIKRNRAILRARKVDVDRKLASLSEFDAKLMQREKELSRSLTEC